MSGDTFSSIVQPLYDLVVKMLGIIDLQILHLESNQIVFRATCTEAETILKIANAFRSGSAKWSISLLGTDTPSHICLRATLDIKGFTWSDVKREIDYKVCLLKV